LVGHLFPVEFADALVADASSILLVELAELHVLLPHRGEELHGDVDESEADGSAPQCARHGPLLPGSAPAPSTPVRQRPVSYGADGARGLPITAAPPPGP